MSLLLLAATVAQAAVPTAVEAGRALAGQQRCRDLDGFTDCTADQPNGATFGRLSCAATGRTSEGEATARCVFKGATLRTPSGSRVRHGDGAIDVVERVDDHGRPYWVAI